MIGGWLKIISAIYRMASKQPISQPEVDDEVDQMVAQPKQRKSTKGRPRTPAQQEAFSKALAILKEKREMRKKDETERFEKATAEEKERIAKEKFEKAKNHKKKLPPAPSYVTTGDLEKFKLDILNALPKHVEPVKVVEQKPIVEAPTPKKAPVEKVVQKPLTGHDLLDKLFFS